MANVPSVECNLVSLREVLLQLMIVWYSLSVGTMLDGEPIINLPPKTIELKKVDFTTEERNFYSKLESDSRAQFAVSVHVEVFCDLTQAIYSFITFISLYVHVCRYW